MRVNCSSIAQTHISIRSEGEVGVVRELSSQIAMLTRALREKERELKEIQHKQSRKVSSIRIGSRIIAPNVSTQMKCCMFVSIKGEQSSIHPGIFCSTFQVSGPPVSS